VLRIYGVFGLALLVVWLYALFDAITSDPAAVRNLPKGFWILIVLLTSEIGAILWFIAGRPQTVVRPGGLPYKGNVGLPPPPRGSVPRGSVTRGSVAPDDDPAFLAELGRSQREHEQMLGAWEADLRRREQQMRDGKEPDTGTTS